MAITESQVLVDTFNRYLVKRVNVGNTETAAVFVNAAALGFALSTLTLTAGANNFKVGEVLTSNSGGTGTVQAVTNSTSVNIINANGTFTTGHTITGGTSTKTRMQSGALGAVTKEITVSKIIYNVGPQDAILQLDWAGDGTSNHRSIAVLSGSGVWELDQLAARANNNAINPTGSILVTTSAFGAGSHYTLILDVGKSLGYSTPQLEQNGALGY